MSWLPPGVWRRLLLGLWALAAPLQAAPSGAGGGEEPEGSDSGDRRPSLSARFGVEHVASSLTAPRLGERLAAIQRLAGLGTPAALHRLVSFALERRAQLGAREWLTLARALASHARDDETRVVLALLMNQRAADPSGPAEAALFELARGTAALALAASGSEGALRVLGAALRAGGAGAALAAEALRAYPPVDLERLLAVPGEPSVEFARWLGALGDQRAFHPLRAWVRGGGAEVRAAAAIALTELGQLETVPLARQWLKSGVPLLERAGIEILVRTQQPEAAGLLRQQLASERPASERLGQALDFPSAELLPPAADLGAEERSAGGFWTLLGRIGGSAAVDRLEAGLGHSESAFAAAHALSRLPGADGHAALLHALDTRLALAVTSRAAAQRAALWQERFAPLRARLSELLESKVESERAAGAWGSSLSGAREALAELASGDRARVEAAANNALWFDDQVLAGAARRLSEAAPGRARSAFAFALLRPSGRRAVTSGLLESLVLEGGAAAPLALRVLASRDEPRFDAFAEAYLAHPDAILRAHVARGLGESVRASAVGRLARSFEFETDESVRQAIVRALSCRRGPTVQRTLDLAARLDPSPKVRAAARLALGGVQLRDPPPGNEFLWAELRSQPPIQSEPGLLHVVPGLAVPVFADAAGILVVAGVSVHPLALRWH